MRSPASRWRSYGGELPSDEETLLSFKGIGAYTAGAVRSFAFGQRAAILDTNVARVLFRVFVGRGKPKAHAMRAHSVELSRTVLPMRHVFDFNQALMDFGATLCTARKPKCLICPMRDGCAAYPFNPDNEACPEPTSIVVTAAVIERDGRFLVTRRPRGMHLEGMWEFPGGKCERGETHDACLRREIREELGCDATSASEAARPSPRLCRPIVELHFFRCELAGEPQPLLGQEIRWVAARRSSRGARFSAGRRTSSFACWLDERRSDDGDRSDGIVARLAGDLEARVPGSAKSRCT